MSRGRSEHRDNLLLIAATTILILTAQRYFQTSTTPTSADPAVAPSEQPVRPLSQHGRGRTLNQPFSDSVGGLEGHPVAHL